MYECFHLSTKYMFIHRSSGTTDIADLQAPPTGETKSPDCTITKKHKKYNTPTPEVNVIKPMLILLHDRSHNRCIQTKMQLF